MKNLIKCTLQCLYYQISLSLQLFTWEMRGKIGSARGGFLFFPQMAKMLHTFNVRSGEDYELGRDWLSGWQGGAVILSGWQVAGGGRGSKQGQISDVTSCKTRGYGRKGNVRYDLALPLLPSEGAGIF